MEKIIQIIPAPSGMSAQYEEHEPNEPRVRVGHKIYQRVPIACQALVQDESGNTAIRPMIVTNEGEYQFATTYEDFISLSFGG